MLVPKMQIDASDLTVFFVHFASSRIKAAFKMLVNVTQVSQTQLDAKATFQRIITVSLRAAYGPQEEKKCLCRSQ